MVGKGVKDGKGKAAPPKGKKDRQTPEGPPAPPMVITNEQLVHKNWWPVIGMVVENSPVESLLVDLMVDCVKGNSVIAIKKDDLLQEANNLLKQHRTPFVPEENLSRREKEKLEKERIAKKKADEELQRQKEKEEAERALLESQQNPNELGTNSKTHLARPVSKMSSSKPGVSKPAKNEGHQGQSIVAGQLGVPPVPTVRPHSLADDLFEELQYFNKDRPLEEVLRNPTIPTLVLLIKYKLLLLKKSDKELFDAVRTARQFPDKDQADDHPQPPLPSKSAMLKGHKDHKGPAAPATAVPGTVKTVPASGSIGKGKLPGKGKGVEEEITDPPPLADDECLVESLYVDIPSERATQKRAKARARGEIPADVVDVLLEQEDLEYEADNHARTGRNNAKKTVRLSLSGSVLEDDSIGKVIVNDLMGDVEVVKGNKPATVVVGDGPAMDGLDEGAIEMQKMQGLLLASIVGVDGLPKLSHALSTKLGLYGVPAFPTSRNQMVRYIILQGFTDAGIVDEMNNKKAPITCLVKIQFLRQRSAPPLRLSNLLWVRRPVQQNDTLTRFWIEIDRNLENGSPGATVNQLCPLALQAKCDMTEHTTKDEFVRIARETGERLGSLLYQVVKAKTLFQFYNSSLAVQHVPRFRKEEREKIDHPEFRDVFDFMADLAERGNRLSQPPVEPPPEISIPVPDGAVPPGTMLSQPALSPATANLAPTTVPPVVNTQAVTPGTDTSSPDSTPPPTPLEKPPDFTALVQDYIKSLEMDLYQRGIINTISRRQRIITPQVNSRHELYQLSRTDPQMVSVLRRLGLDPKTLEHIPSKVPVGMDPVVGQKLIRALERPEIKLVFIRQWIDKMFRIVKKKIGSLPSIFISDDEHVNSLAEAMSAWRTSTQIKKHIPSSLEEKYEFIIPKYAQPIDPAGAKLRTPPPYLAQLLTMENYYTIVSYTTKHLLTALSEADRQYFHHSIRYDKSCKKIFIIFYALHEKHSHSHVRRSETRLHSRADFATFVCNIMENVQTWADENLNRAYRCPRRAGQISPQFPYGCQSQIAYQDQCTTFFDSPENDHFQMFLRKNSLKNLVRNNKDLFAQRCNWRDKIKGQMSTNQPSANQLNVNPVDDSSRLNINQSNASLAPSSINSNISVNSTGNQPITHKKDKTIPPFIWNRANEPLPPDCTAASAHRLTSAYSLTNVLTKIVRHEEKIYCPDAMVLIDSSESFNEKIFVHITVLMNEDLEIYVNDSEQGRRISVEFNTSTFLSFEKDETGQVAISIFDVNGIVTRVGNDQEVFCEMEVANENDTHGKTLASAVRKNGIVHRVLTNGTLECHQPDGRRAKPEDEEAPLIFQESIEDFQRPLTPTRKSMHHFEPPHTIVYISSSGLQRSVEKHRSGFIRRVQVNPELRITTHRVYPEEQWDPVEEAESDAYVSIGKHKPMFVHYSPRNKILVEQPGFPRVAVDLVSKLNSISLQNGVLLVKKDNFVSALVAGVNVVLITTDGLLFAGKLLQYCEILDLMPVQIGTFGYASPEFVEFVDSMITRATEDSGWQRNETLLKFALSGEIIAACQDLSGLKHDLLQNGEAVHQMWEDKVDRCVMPPPRIFVIDPDDKTGNEYLFGEQAVALKYKIASHYIPNKRCRYPDSTLPKVIQKECFGCSVSDEPLGEWSYTDRDVLPAALLSDLKGTTDHRATDGSAPRDRAFRYRNESSETVAERWKKVLFVPERLKKY